MAGLGACRWEGGIAESERLALPVSHARSFTGRAGRLPQVRRAHTGLHYSVGRCWSYIADVLYLRSTLGSSEGFAHSILYMLPSQVLCIGVVVVSGHVWVVPRPVWFGCAPVLASGMCLLSCSSTQSCLPRGARRTCALRGGLGDECGCWCSPGGDFEG